MDSICLLNLFVNRCNDIAYNLCSQIFAIFNGTVINFGKF